jgi:hypothetical protein
MFDARLCDDHLNITHRPILEAVMLAPGDAVSLAAERASGRTVATAGGAISPRRL